jgi:hypothetical protein
LLSNSLWYPLRYSAEYEGGQTINQRIHYHYPTAEDVDQILSLNTFRDFGGGNVYNASFGSSTRTLTTRRMASVLPAQSGAPHRFWLP